MVAADLPLLAAWLGTPHVAEWWPGEPTDIAEVEAKYLPCITGDDPTELFVISLDGRAVGMVQRYRVDDEPEWAAVLAQAGIDNCTGAVGIDYLVGEPTVLRQGVGSAAIKAATALDSDVVVSVQQGNVGSWRALERCGFTRVWAGQLMTDDLSDAGPAYIYRLDSSGDTGSA